MNYRAKYDGNDAVYAIYRIFKMIKWIINETKFKGEISI
jgi:hypothetical protein